MQIIAIDADNFIYKAGCIRKFDMFPTEHDGYFCENDTDPSDELRYQSYLFLPLEVSKRIIDDKIDFIKQHFYAEFLSKNSCKFEYYLSPDDGSNFRNKPGKYQQYKANRKKNNPKQPIPFYFNELRKHIIDEYKAIVADGMEADDAVCMRAYEDDQTIAVSNDKDVLYSFAGEKFDHEKGERFNIFEHQGVFYFFCQMLMGDTADNVKGIHGMGPVKADKNLNAAAISSDEEDLFNSYFLATLELYKTAFKEDSPQDLIDRFNETANLLWLRRSNDDHWSNHFDTEDVLKKAFPKNKVKICLNQ